ncbi:hypothetical protein SAMN04489806_0832 [Paramicrobacterium humi]|uniref:VOC domain-containing protein n=1 Tax=Paramicrobacterium humi TaxID=640635 RepID=A0A1H4JRI3_9MICO|nr:VOC family protein [Microbacterium humi]SEB48944.1 hypothetical protein SAMN04489806_0832 [Microbacterium humi]
MDQSVHFITIATANLDAAREFYNRGAGWMPLLDVPGEILFYQVAPGTVLGLFDADKFAQDAGLPAPAEVSGVTLAHNVGSRAEVEHVVARLAEHGGTVLKEPQEGAFGGVFHALVADPNGAIWEIAHNPVWRVDDDGRVSFASPDDA